MTVLHLIIGLSAGGAEHMVLELANQCQIKGHKPIVVSLTKRDLILNKFIDKNITCYFLNITSVKSLRNGLGKLKEINSKNPGLVFHCHMFHALMVGLIYKIFIRNTPIIFTLHTNKVKQFYRKVALFLTMMLRSKDIIFSVNSKKWYLKNSISIPNGVDLSKFKSKEKRYIKDTLFKFLFLGRLTEPKNPLFLVQLTQKLIEANHKNFIINVVGDGGLKEDLEKAIVKNNLSKYIKLLGFQNKVSKFLSESDCLIIPSLWEGMPVSIIEAGASKLPVISTPVGSIPDFLNDNNAYVKNLEDFHSSMISVLINYSDADKKGENLFKLVKNKYDIEKVSDLHIKLYKSTLV